MKNVIEDKIDKSISDVPSFDETWNRVDVTKLEKKKSKKPWIIGLCSGGAALVLTAAVVTPLALLNKTPESYSGVTLLRHPAKAEYNSNTSVISKDFKEKLNNFSAKFTDLAYDYLNSDGENQCVSPLSLYMALSLVEECTSGTARDEVLSALGMTHEDVSTMTKPLFESSTREYYGGDTSKTLMGRESLTNSIWGSPSFSKKDECLDDLANNLYCYPYEADWANNNKSANSALRKFISEQTNGLIDHDWNFDTSTLFLLMNTLYWKDAWLETGEELAKWTSDYSFEDYAGLKKSMTAYRANYINGKTYESEAFRTCFARTSHGYKLKFVIPKDGYSLKEIWNQNTIKEVNSVDYGAGAFDDLNNKQYQTRCIFPEFSLSYVLDLGEIFRDCLGINEIFANPRSFSTLTDDYCLCGGALQETRLDITKKGGEGAAVTIIYQSEATSYRDAELVSEDFVVDRAFGYILTDSNDVPLFSGVVNQIE